MCERFELGGEVGVVSSPHSTETEEICMAKKFAGFSAACTTATLAIALALTAVSGAGVGARVVSLAHARGGDVQNHFDGKTWWAYIKVLADDNMEGRDTGSDGLRRAEAYIVEQLKMNGLEPAGSGGFYQPVKFESREIIEKDSSAALVRDGKSEPLTLGEDVYFGTRADLAPEVEAPLVFIGYGLKIPEQNYDDLAGLDLKGKVVVFFAGSTAETAAALSAHYQSAGERWKSLRAAGAIGWIAIPNPASMDIPWSRMTANRTHPSMVLADPQFNETDGLKLSLTVNPASAEKFFAGSGHTFAEIAALGKERKTLPRFPLAVSIQAKAKIEKTAVESANVIAKLPGSDPALKDEYVVLSAHVDHVGIGARGGGSRRSRAS
jgi:hypothetical protein